MDYRRGISKTLSIGIIIVLVIAVIGGALAFKGRGGKGTGTMTTTTPPSYNKLVIGMVASQLKLDPAIADDYASWFILSRTMEGLVKINPKTGGVEPGLAIKWYTTDNGKTWIFILRNNLRFSDGTPCKANDVVKSIERTMFLHARYSWLVTGFIYNIQPINDTAIKIELKQPIQDFPSLTALPPYYVVSPKYPLQQPAPQANYGGIGPYKIKTITNNQIILTINEQYYGEKPHIKELVIRIYHSSKQLADALRSGEIDVAWWGLTPRDADQLKTEGFKVIESDKSALVLLALNTIPNNPTSSIKIRQAIAYALDPNAIASSYDGEHDNPVFSILPSNYFSYIPVFKSYSGQNKAKAQSLLGSKGYNTNNRLHLRLVTSSEVYGEGIIDIAKLIKKQLESTEVVSIDINDLPASDFYNALDNGNYDLALVTVYPVYPDPSYYMLQTLYSQANVNLGITYANPQVDSELIRSLATVDYSLRQAIYERIENTTLISEIPLIPLIEYSTLVAMKPSIQGIGILPNMMLSLP